MGVVWIRGESTTLSSKRDISLVLVAGSVQRFEVDVQQDLTRPCCDSSDGTSLDRLHRDNLLWEQKYAALRVEDPAAARTECLSRHATSVHIASSYGTV